MKGDILGFLDSVDIPLSDIEVELAEIAVDDMAEHLPKDLAADPIKNSGARRIIKDICMSRLDNTGAQVKLSIANESSGTKILFSLSGPLLDALKNGNTLFIDELHNNLHPLALNYLIDLFASSKANSMGAQLVFTSHDSSILDYSSLQRDQIWFVSKDGSLSTSAVSLSSFRERRTVSLQKAYLNGRFGAVPVIDDTELD